MINTTITEHMATAAKSSHHTVNHYDYPHQHHRRNDVASITRSELGGGSGSFRLSTSFSVASFRRKIIDSIRCGGSGVTRCLNDDDFLDISLPIKLSSTRHDQLDQLSSIHSSEIRSELSSGRGSTSLLDFLSIPISATAVGGIVEKGRGGSDGDEERRKKKVERFEEMLENVKMLSRSEINMKWDGAKSVRRLAKDDSEARTTIAKLGAVTNLVEMLDLDEDEDGDGLVRIDALYALLNLSIGNDRNKQAIVNAGAIYKMLQLIKPCRNGFTSSSPPNQSSILEPIVANFLSLTASDTNKPIIGSTTNAIPFLVNILKHPTTTTNLASQDALKALHNLSIHPSNIAPILATDLIPHLITTLRNDTTATDDCSGRSLSILTNLVTTQEGRFALTSAGPDTYPILIDILNWIDSPVCQEKAAHLLLIMLHKGGYSDRRAMIEAGIASAALELTLIGSVLAQKRGSRILECLRMDKGKHHHHQRFESTGSGWGSTLSAPMSGGANLSSSCSTSSCSSSSCLTTGGGGVGNNSNGGGQVVVTELSDEKRAVKELVHLSLQSNMRNIARRANLVHDFVGQRQHHHHRRGRPSSLASSSSLPF